MMTFMINNGFWIAMGTITFIVIAMNLVFWNIPPKKKSENTNTINIKK
ncbi:MAG: hypothetical protein RR614_07875 [Eubacterium sp.]